MIGVLIASTGWAQQADLVSQICQGNQTNPYVECSQNSTSDTYSSLSANTVKTATIAVFILCLAIVLIICLSHVCAGLRKRKKWKIITRIVCIEFDLIF